MCSCAASITVPVPAAVKAGDEPSRNSQLRVDLSLCCKQEGSTKVPLRFSSGSAKVKLMFNQGSTSVPSKISLLDHVHPCPLPSHTRKRTRKVTNTLSAQCSYTQKAWPDPSPHSRPWRFPWAWHAAVVYQELMQSGGSACTLASRPSSPKRSRSLYIPKESLCAENVLRVLERRPLA